MSPGTLARDLVVRGVTIPAGSTFLDEEPLDDRVYTISRATVVHGVEVAVGSTIAVGCFPPPISACFNLLLVPLLYPLLVWWRLWELVVEAVFVIEPAEPLRVGDVPIHRGDRIRLGRKGLRSLTMRSPRVIAGHELETGTVRFERPGRAREIVLYRPQRIRGIPCVGSGLIGTEVLLDEAGRVRRCVLSEDAMLGGTRYRRGTRITLDERGRVTATKATLQPARQ